METWTKLHLLIPSGKKKLFFYGDTADTFLTILSTHSADSPSIQNLVCKFPVRQKQSAFFIHSNTHNNTVAIIYWPDPLLKKEGKINLENLQEPEFSWQVAARWNVGAVFCSYWAGEELRLRVSKSPPNFSAELDSELHLQEEFKLQSGTPEPPANDTLLKCIVFNKSLWSNFTTWFFFSPLHLNRAKM